MKQDYEKKTIQKKPWVAGLLSLLLPGLGHFYIGQVKKAIGFHAGIWGYLLLIWFLPLGYTFAKMIAMLCLGLAYDITVSANAVVATKKNQVIVQKKYDQWYVYLLIIFATGIVFEFVYQPAKDKWAHIQFASSPTTAMAPALTTGDKFAWRKTKAIEKDDITVFEFPGEAQVLYVSRCVASPGDKLEIKEGKVFINDQLADHPERLKFRYQVQINGRLNPSKLEKLGIEEIFHAFEQNYTANLTTTQVEELKKISIVSHISTTFETEGTPTSWVFPSDTDLKWNTDFYGPLILPKKGQSIEINEENAALYKTVIQTCENESQVALNKEKLLVINGQVVRSYTFKQDYYFMMGDNRHNSLDSRYKGLIPDNLIKGKALYIWWSNNREKIGGKI